MIMMLALVSDHPMPDTARITGMAALELGSLHCVEKPKANVAKGS
jgi:hypothetical protein